MKILWKNLKTFLVDIVDMIKKYGLYASLAISAILVGGLAWFLNWSPTFDSYWVFILFNIFKTMGYYLMGFLFIYCAVIFIMINIPKYEFKESTVVKFGLILAWIISFVTVIMIIGFISAFLIVFLAKYMPKPLVLILTYSIFLLLFVFIRDKIKGKSGLDIFNVRTFFKD